MIKGITPTLAEGGKIKIGGLGAERTSKAGKKYRIPEKWDHFMVTSTARNAKGDFAADVAVMDALEKDESGKVTSIPIILHSDDIEEVFPTTYALYSGRKLQCRGDGETAELYQIRKGAKTGKMETRDCPCPELDANKCKPHGTLHCSIAVPGQALAGAVHKWRTTSLISIQRVIGSLKQIKATCGTMRGLPLVLRLTSVDVSPDGVKASTVYCCHVELRASDLMTAQSQALEMVERRNAIGGAVAGEPYKALVSRPAIDESEQEQAEIAAEFYPESETEGEPDVLADVLDCIAQATDGASLVKAGTYAKMAELRGNDSKAARRAYVKRAEELDKEPKHNKETGEVYDYGPPEWTEEEA